MHRSVFVPDLISALRLEVGLSPRGPAPSEAVASRGRPLPVVADAVDLGAWIAWALAGLPLFARRTLPTMRETAAVARRVLLGVAMDRVGGNLTRAAAMLGVSRRAVREHLRQLGLYGLEPEDYAGDHLFIDVSPPHEDDSDEPCAGSGAHLLGEGTA